MKHANYHLSRLFLAAIVVAGMVARAYAQQTTWDFEPYSIQAVLALDLPGGMAEKLSEALPAYLQNRVEGAIGPIWHLNTQVASGPLRYRVLKSIDSFTGAPPADFPDDGDKLLLVAIRAVTDGYEFTSREFDRYVQRWGPPVRRIVRQQAALGEQLFDIAWRTIAPLAHYELDEKDEHRVILKFRGGALPRKNEDVHWTVPGEALLPLVRRSINQGGTRTETIQPVPWTYFETVGAKDGGITAQIRSGMRRPIAARRGGRSEQVAIALRNDPGDTVVHLQSRTAKDKPLAGYEVFAQNAGQEATNSLGHSDASGRIVVPAGKTPIQMLIVKNGGALLARLPIVPGSEPQLAVPLPDDEIRLAVEIRLSALREDLIDAVARRNILLARARQKIENKDYAAAAELLTALDALPTRAQFVQTLAKEARLHQSDDAQIQRRIEQLIAQTQTILGQYLDAKPINELHDQLREAGQKSESTRDGA